MRYMLDTNILSELIRNPTGPAAQRARTVASCTSIIVAAELRYGSNKKGSPNLTRKVEQLLTELPVIPFDAPADAEYGAIRSELERIGQSIGSNDLLIAAHAKSLQATLVTANVAEFRRVRTLKVENWMD